jgi:hypothetical protein
MINESDKQLRGYQTIDSFTVLFIYNPSLPLGEQMMPKRRDPILERLSIAYEIPHFKQTKKKSLDALDGRETIEIPETIFLSIFLLPRVQLWQIFRS